MNTPMNELHNINICDTFLQKNYILKIWKMQKHLNKHSIQFFDTCNMERFYNKFLNQCFFRFKIIFFKNYSRWALAIIQLCINNDFTLFFPFYSWWFFLFLSLLSFFYFFVVLFFIFHMCWNKKRVWRVNIIHLHI
jgi:hypothetical protein